jgi:capsular polysaccharide biosynthesis protein
MFGINSGSGTGEKLIYLTRSNTKWRRVTNEIKLFERLEQLGFEMIDPGKMSIDEQLLLAQQTRLAISPMGAGSNYFLFMKDGTRFIELTPQNKLMNVSPMFAKRSQIKFQQVLGTPKPSAGQNELDSDFEVDIEALIKLL